MMEAEAEAQVGMEVSDVERKLANAYGSIRRRNCYDNLEAARNTSSGATSSAKQIRASSTLA